MKNGGSFHCFLYVHQRVCQLDSNGVRWIQAPQDAMGLDIKPFQTKTIAGTGGEHAQNLDG